MTVSGDKVSLIVQVSLRQIVFLIEEIVSCGGDKRFNSRSNFSQHVMKNYHVLETIRTVLKTFTFITVIAN